MPYSSTTWVENVTTLGPTNMNKIEQALAKMPYGPDFITGNAPVWNGSAWAQTATPACCARRQGANQAIPNTTWTLVNFDVEDFDTDTIHDTTTNTDRLTCKTAGKYLVTAAISYVNNATGERLIKIQKNVEVVSSGFEGGVKAMAVGSTNVLATGLIDLVVNDYVCCVTYQNCGGALDVQAGITFCAMYRVGA